MTVLLRALAIAAALALTIAAPAAAQVGTTTDIIMGRVVGPDSQPLVGARVEVTSTETQITRRRTTGDDGRYTIVFPDGGGSYQVNIAYLGMAPVRFALMRQGDEDRLVGDVVLGRVATQLATVEVRAQQRQPQIQRPEAGSTERGLPAGLVNRLPVDASNLDELATLAPGVVGIPETDSSRAAFSVAGQPPDQNSITLDGLSFGSGSVPQEAIRGTRVITNTYDVARGQFTGGQVMSTTRGGTNRFQGAVNYSLRDPSLEFAEEITARRYRQNRISVGFGGPIVRDKLFVFGAGQWNRRTEDLLSLVDNDPLTLSRLGTNADSVTRFLGLLDSFGIPARLAAPTGDRITDNTSALLRLDYSFADAHTLMLRGDWRWQGQEPSRVSPLSVPHSGGETSSSGAGAMATITSQLGQFINELRAYASVDNRDITSFVEVPDGRVTIASVLDDGTRSVSTLQFGGNPSLPQETKTALIEASNELSRVSRRGGHRIKLGALINEERSSVGFIPNRFGTFTFNSLDDFEANQPASFTRTLLARDDESVTRNVALYLGDSWRRSPALQLVYGVRLEGSVYPSEPDYNPEVEALFARRTDRLPSELHLSPRIGFTYNRFPEIGGRPTVTIRGGFGEYRGRASPSLFSTARNTTGLTDGQATLTCVGSSVPTPDWPAYLLDPANIPSSCVGSAPVFGSQARNVTVFADDFAAPRAWRGSLGLSRRLRDRFNLTIEGSVARGVAQTGARDLNLDTIPEFTLAAEAGRPVYVPPSTIVPATGATALAGSRLHAEFGRVSEVMSELKSSTQQLTTRLDGFLWRGASFNLSYTLTHGRDETQGFSQPSGGFGGFVRGLGGGGWFGGGGNTAGNPNHAEWGPSDNARTHSFLATITYPVKPWLDVSAIGRAFSGSRYAPIVGGDINGDGLRNDRAFIFDPANTADTAVANGMSRLLASTSDRARECLEAGLGKIASRGACTTPWFPSLDLQFNIRPSALGLDRRLTISVLALNTLAGLDQLFHGDNLRGWGQRAIPDRTLLHVRGFDPTTNSYRYEVNENFGAPTGGRSAFRSPFQLALQARLAVGTDPARAQFRRVLQGRGGQRQSPEQLRERMQRAVPNAFREILAIDDSLQLALTDDQKQQLTVAGDSFQVRADTLIGALATVLAGAEQNAEPMRVGQQMQSRIREGRELAVAAVREAQRILTPAQWEKVPPRIKQPFRPGEGGRGGGPMIFMGGPPE